MRRHNHLNALAILLVIATLWPAGRCAAQTTARTILDKTAAVLSQSGGISATFSMSGSGTLSGTLIVKGNKFKATTPRVVLWYDGTTQWAYMKATEEVNVTTPTDAQSLSPYKFINLYKKGYEASYTKSGTGYQVHLTAQASSRTIKEVYIAVNSRYEPTQLKVRTADGWTVINITGVKAGNYPDTTFRFDAKAYPNAEVIDLR